MIDFVKIWLKTMAITVLSAVSLFLLVVIVGWLFNTHLAIALGLFFLLATAAMAVIFRPTE